MSRHRFWLSSLPLLLVLLLVQGCDEGTEPAAPEVIADATVALDVQARGFGTQDARTANAFRVSVLNSEGTTLRTVSGAFSEDPNRTFGPYPVPIGSGPVTAARVEFEVFWREGDAETVIWSGVATDVTLTPGERTDLGLEVFRGPLAHLQLSSIQIQGLPEEIGVGETFQGEGSASPSGTPLDPSWGSLDPAVASVDAEGRVTGLSEGTARIVIAAGPVSDTVEVRVRSLVGSIVLSRDALSFESLGDTFRLEAEVLSFRGEPLTGVPIEWMASPSGVVSVSQGGLVRAVGNGEGEVTASVGAVAASIPVSIAQAPAAFVIRPASATLVPGEVRTFSARVEDALGSPISGYTVEWSTSDPRILTVDASGIATAGQVGQAQLLAAADTLTATAEVEVRPGAVASLTLESGGGQSGEIGSTLADEVRVLALDAEGFPVPGQTVSWSASDGGAVLPSIASTDSAGEAGVRWTLGSTPGTQTLTASAGGITLEVHAEAVDTAPAALTISPPGTSFTAVGETRTFTAQVFNALGNPIPDATVSWSTLDDQVASVDAEGVVTAEGVGTTSLVAISGPVSDTVSVSVGQTPDQVVVSPDPLVLASIGAEQQFTAEVLDTEGDPIPGAEVAWSSNDAAVITIDPVSGLATSTGIGATTIQATSGGITGFADVTVSQVPASIEVAPPTAGVEPGETVQLGATVLDAEGTVIPGAPVDWASDDDTIAEVDGDGLVTGEAEGVATIEASSGTVSSTAVITVGPPIPDALEIVAGDEQSAPAGLELPDALQVRVLSAFGRTVPGVTVTWSAQDGGTATPAASDSDGDGIAEARWALGPATGAQELTASIPGASVDFAATATGASRVFDRAAGSHQVAVTSDPDDDFDFPDSDWTLSFWVRTDDPNPDPVAFQYAFSGGLSAFDTGVNVYIDPNLGGRWTLSARGASQGGFYGGNSGGAIPPGEWQHLVVRRSGTTVTLWIDGTEITRTAGPLQIDEAIPSSGTPRLGVIGNLSEGWFGGAIAQVARWSTALTPTQIAAMAGGTHALDVESAARDWFLPLGRDPEAPQEGAFSVTVTGATAGGAPPVLPPTTP